MAAHFAKRSIDPSFGQFTQRAPRREEPVPGKAFRGSGVLMTRCWGTETSAACRARSNVSSLAPLQLPRSPRWRRYQHPCRSGKDGLQGHPAQCCPANLPPTNAADLVRRPPPSLVDVGGKIAYPSSNPRPSPGGLSLFRAHPPPLWRRKRHVAYPQGDLPWLENLWF